MRMFSRKRVLFEFVPPRKSCLGGKIGCETAQKFLFRGVFPQKVISLSGYVLKTSGHACVQH